MATVDRLFLATLTKNEDDAGTDAGKLNLTVNVNGEDLVDSDFGFLNGSGILSSGLGPDDGWLSDGQAALSDQKLEEVLDTSLLTHSSVRVGNRSDDAWAPQHIFVFGATENGAEAIAMETDIEHWLSTDSDEGKLTMPIRLVDPGTSITVIRRVLLLIYTGSGSDVETDSPIELQISTNNTIVLQETVFDTPQDDLEQYTANWYFMKAAVPFTRAEIIKGKIRLSIKGDDAWLPQSVFVFGLDTEEGRPNSVVRLVSLANWDLGSLSADPSEGKDVIDLPVS